MATKLSIWNRALQIMGSEKIVDEAIGNKKTRSLETAYEPTRDALMEEFPWGFCKKFWKATYDGTYSPDHTYSYQYIVPSDYIGLINIKTSYPYEEISAVTSPDSGANVIAIATNDPGPLEVKYVARIENPAVYSPLFAELLAHRVALNCCEEINQSNTKKADIMKAMMILEKKAKIATSRRRTPEPLDPGSWIESAGFVNIQE